MFTEPPNELALASLQLLQESVRCAHDEEMSEDVIDAAVTLLETSEREDGDTRGAVLALARASAAMLVIAAGDRETAGSLVDRHMLGAVPGDER